jgi:hypothetical protein
MTLSVTFEGQSGVDWGGITKIFINKLSDCMFDLELPDPIWSEVRTAHLHSRIAYSTFARTFAPLASARLVATVPYSKFSCICACADGQRR